MYRNTGMVALSITCTTDSNSRVSAITPSFWKEPYPGSLMLAQYCFDALAQPKVAIITQGLAQCGKTI